MDNRNKNLMDQLSNLQIEGIDNPVLDPNMTVEQLQQRANEPFIFAPGQEPQPALRNEITPPVPTMVQEKQAEQVQNNFVKNPPTTLSGAENKEDMTLKPESLLTEYQNLMKNSDQELEDARNADRNRLLVGALGDALGTYLNAKGQMNVKAPGVQVKQGVGALDLAQKFNQLPDAQKSIDSKRKALLEQYKALAKAQGGDLTAYQKQSLQLQKDRMDLQRELEAGRENRSDKNMSLREKQQNRISDKQLDALDSYDQTLNSFARIKELKSKIDTGPIAEKRNAAARLVGLDDPNVTALRTEILDTLATKIKALSGTAANESEVKRLAVTLPELSNSDEVFNRKLEDAEQRIKEAYEIRKKSYEKQGKDVSSFKKEESQPKQEEKVIVIGPDGKASRLPKRQLEAALKQGYKLQE